MKRSRFASLILALAMSFALAISMALSAGAYAAGDINAEASNEIIVEEAPVEEPEEEHIPLTPDGNGTLADDTVSGSKQFITIETKNGNYFYLILDRDREGSNACMLAQIDEADLEEFVEKEEEPVVMEPVIQEPEPVVTEPAPEEQPETESKGKEKGNSMLSLLILAAVGGAAFYYFKVFKPKNEKPQPPNIDEMEFEDDPEINEDGEDNNAMGNTFVEDDLPDDDT